MTSVSSRGLTPHSPFESGNDTDDSWQFLNSYAPSSVGFLPSPASGSLNGYAIVGNVTGSDHAGLSPLNLDRLDSLDQGNFSAASFPDQTETFAAPVPSSNGHFNDSEFLTPQGYLFQHQLNGEYRLRSRHRRSQC